MSILLDALKKSEAQRKLGETPTIHSSTEPALAHAPAVRPWLVVLMMLSVAAVITLYVIEQFDEPDLSILGYSEITPADPVASTATDASAGAAETTSDDRTPVERFRPGFGNRQQVSETETRSRPSFTESVSSYEPPAETEAVDPPPGEPLADAQQIASISSADLAQSQNSANSRSRADRAVEAPAEPPMLTYWQLPQSVRDNMSELKISVLVYAANPEDRFILMEGQRLREGDSAGGGLDLEEIRRDGAVFSYRRYTFLLPN